MHSWNGAAIRDDRARSMSTRYLLASEEDRNVTNMLQIIRPELRDKHREPFRLWNLCINISIINEFVFFCYSLLPNFIWNFIFSCNINNVYMGSPITYFTPRNDCGHNSLTIVNIASKCRYQSLQSWFVQGGKNPKEWTNERNKNRRRKGACVVLKCLIIKTCCFKEKKNVILRQRLEPKL